MKEKLNEILLHSNMEELEQYINKENVKWFLVGMGLMGIVVIGMYL